MRRIGLSLARMEIKVTCREVARQLKDIRLAIAESAISYVPTVAVRTLEALPITFAKKPA